MANGSVYDRDLEDNVLSEEESDSSGMAVGSLNQGLDV